MSYKSACPTQATDVLDKYAKWRNAKEQPAADEEHTIDVPGFGWLRGIRDTAIMLEIRHRDGHITAFSHNMLDQAEVDPSDGMTLTFYPRTTVKIAGRNINDEVRPNVRLFAGILQHRVAWIQEADEPTAMKPRGAAG